MGAILPFSGVVRNIDKWSKVGFIARILRAGSLLFLEDELLYFF
jgi:hypothetical protein